jgi:type IV pilus assembly protein PilP
MMSRDARRLWQFVASCLAVFSLNAGTELSAQEEESVVEKAYHYTATGKRDPFVSPFATRIAETEPAVEEAKTPLQRFDLGQLKLVGVIWAADEPRALIEDGGGLGYIVTRGTLIGSRGGVVKTIEQKRILVEEYEVDFFGKRQAQERELRLIVTDSAPAGKKKEK